MLLLHGLLSAVHQPETNVALLLRPVCFQRCLPSVPQLTFVAIDISQLLQSRWWLKSVERLLIRVRPCFPVSPTCLMEKTLTFSQPRGIWSIPSSINDASTTGQRHIQKGYCDDKLKQILVLTSSKAKTCGKKLCFHYLFMARSRALPYQGTEVGSRRPQRWLQAQPVLCFRPHTIKWYKRWALLYQHHRRHHLSCSHDQNPKWFCL